MRNLCLTFLALASFSVVSCAPKGDYRSLGGQAQGTTFNITYEAINEADYSFEIDSLFRFIDKSMSLWDSTSLISRVNRNETVGPLDQHFKAVLEASIDIQKKTDGYFNVTVGPLVKSWGFVTKKNLAPPTPLQIDSLKELISVVKIVGDSISKQNSNCQLDFNAIAQGYTVDLMAAHLESKGIKNYLIEIGGEVLGKGKNSEGKPWKVGIEKPEQEQTGIASIIELSNKALATSGSYRKFFVKDGKKYSHAVDPHTGYPVQHQLLSISVLASDCTKADAYATALLVMGLDKAKVFAEKNKIDFFAIYDENNKNQYFSTPGFKRLNVE